MQIANIQTAKHIDNSIEVGDCVYIVDGSGLALCTENYDLNNQYNSPNKILIINSYFELTKSPLKLKDLVGIVIEINVTNYISLGSDKYAYITDIVVQLGNAKFRTCSNFVRKTKQLK